MSVEVHDKLIALLTEVDELKSKEVATQVRETRHLEQIAQSESEVGLCNENSVTFVKTNCAQT